MQSVRYIGDGRAPTQKSENISKVMSSNKDKDKKWICITPKSNHKP